jgi:glucose/arabinose dehydrogenase
MMNDIQPKAAAAAAAAALLLLVQTVQAGCPKILTPSYSPPVVGGGYTAQLVATGLRRPRGMRFDANGALLVVESGQGITHITFDDAGSTCLSVKDKKTLVGKSELNHAVELSPDGKTLYASGADKVYSWAYDAAGASTSGNENTLVDNMSNEDHVSRTLLVPRKSPGTLLVSRGSAENMDMGTRDQSSGRSMIKAFDIANLPQGGPYDFASGGTTVGWGLRNSVGVAEHPTTGGIFSVENSADYVRRNGQDVHQDDPGEEMNFHGFLNGSEPQGKNYGYPDCFALWGGSIPDKGSMTVGSQFSLDTSGELTDAKCASDYVAPRITFQAHTAPLDMIFTPDGSEAYVTFHGSCESNPEALRHTDS